MPVFDVDINTDLLHINGPLCGIYPTAMHPGSIDDELNSVKGKHVVACAVRWCEVWFGGTCDSSISTVFSVSERVFIAENVSRDGHCVGIACLCEYCGFRPFILS